MTENICRFCGKCKENCLNIFEDAELAANAEVCLTKKIFPEDDLPKKCCSCCRDLLVNFANFIAMSNETEKKLRNMKQRSKTKGIDLPALQMLCNKSRTLGNSGDSNPAQGSSSITTIVKKLSLRAGLTMVKVKSDQPDENMNAEESSSSPPPSSPVAKRPPKHLQVVSVPSYFLCTNCKDRFTSFEDLSKHINTAGLCKNQEYKCTTCSKVFNTRKKLYQHTTTHRKRSPQVCDLCGKIYGSRFNLENHKSSVHGYPVEESDTAIYRCRLCSSEFTTRVDLFRHIENHGPSSTHTNLCEKCGKCFMTNEALRAHSRIHTTIPQSFNCPKCLKIFNRKKSLMSHKCIPGKSLCTTDGDIQLSIV
ncbi:hypothetical protein DMENIID0001_082750 [Sergentomyia squamirostris]